jgi:DNA-directed RNA polymerase sigma subunit (sigma70/sigma32)
VAVFDISAASVPLVRVPYVTRALTCPTLTVGVKMQEMMKGAGQLRQVVSPRPKVSLTAPQEASSAEREPPGDPCSRLPAPQQYDLLTAEQELVMTEHLPMVRFIARRIHERLPQHVPIEDIYSAGVVGLLDAFTKFNPSKPVQFRSYAQSRIRGAIFDNLRTLDWSPRALRRKGAGH